MSALPAVLLRLIGEYVVDSIGVLFTLLEIDDDWRRGLEHPTLVSHLRLRFSPGLLAWLGLFTPGIRSLDFPEQVTDNQLEELSLLTGVCELNFSDCCFITGTGLSALRSNTIHTIKLPCCRSLSDQGLMALAHCTSIKHLQLCGCPCVTDKGLVSLSNFAQLEWLDLGGCSKITDIGTRSLAPLRHLQNLKLRHCHRLMDFSFLSDFDTLKMLDLSWCTSITDESILPLARLSGLRSLNLRGCYQLTDDGLQPLTALELDVLNVSGCVNLTMTTIRMPATLQELYASGCDRLQTLEMVEGLSSLRKLHLDDCLKLDGLRPLMFSTTIQLLDLVGCVGITDLDPLAQLKSLAELRLTNCSAITNLSALAPLNALRALYVQWCDIQDDSLQALSVLTRLRELSLFGCGKITDRGLHTLKCLTGMRRLDLGGCRQLSDAGLMKSLSNMSRLKDLSLGDSPGVRNLDILARLPNLVHLRVSDCPLTEQAMKNIGALAKLKTLCLIGCKDFEDASLMHLAQLPLERLDLEAFDAITDAGLSALLNDLKDLHSVYIFNCKHITDVAMPALGTIFAG